MLLRVSIETMLAWIIWDGQSERGDEGFQVRVSRRFGILSISGDYDQIIEAPGKDVKLTGVSREGRNGKDTGICFFFGFSYDRGPSSIPYEHPKV